MRKPVTLNAPATDDGDDLTVLDPAAVQSAQSAHNAQLAASAPSVTSDSNDEEEEDSEETKQDLANTNQKEVDKKLRSQYKSFLKHVGELGTDYGAGKVSQIALAETIVENAVRKLINSTKDSKHVEDIYAKWQEAVAKRAMIATEDGQKVVLPDELPEASDQQLSKIRRWIKLGEELDQTGLEFVRLARDVHIQMKSEGKPVKYAAIYPAVYEASTKQLHNAGKLLSRVEIEQIMAKPTSTSKHPDAAKKLLDAITSATAARKGSEKAGRPPVEDTDLDHAIVLLKEVHRRIDPDGAKKLAEKEDKAGKRKDEAVNTGPTPESQAAHAASLGAAVGDVGGEAEGVPTFEDAAE